MPQQRGYATTPGQPASCYESFGVGLVNFEALTIDLHTTMPITPPATTWATHRLCPGRHGQHNCHYANPMSSELGSGRRNSDDPRGTLVGLRNMLTVRPLNRLLGNDRSVDLTGNRSWSGQVNSADRPSTQRRRNIGRSSDDDVVPQ
eukprot:TRINITY_DN11039_c0_g2_i1.p2 TRINITY_DN11039_c0_g2~~TRINITY_DN11039_c0_g2_i1.p2  ORF type:complete len:147 (+),score=4.03 TRINITY_DN11039_c0_g2_i1:204-644(+)